MTIILDFGLIGAKTSSPTLREEINVEDI